jgi:hypothetical protein
VSTGSGASKTGGSSQEKKKIARINKYGLRKKRIVYKINLN